MVKKLVEDFAGSKFPNDNFGIFASTGNELIALADVYLCDVVFVAVQRGLQS